jgi:hypothetical protein
MYKSPYTRFIAYEKPLVHRVYVKDENTTIAIIDIDDNWQMHGSVINPINKLIHPSLVLDQESCERALMKNMPPENCPDVLEHYGLDKYDCAEIMYRTRAINLLDKTWLAWSEDDKAEDYHPLCNEKLMKIRMKGMMQIIDPDIDMPPIGYESEACRETRLNIERIIKQNEEKEKQRLEDEYIFE